MASPRSCRTRSVAGTWGAFFRSVHGTPNHLLLTDRGWLGRFTGDRAVSQSLDAMGRVIEVRSLGQELYAEFPVLRTERARTDGAIATWVAGLDEGRVEVPFRYRTSAGEACEHPLWWALTHRGQVTTLLKQLGREPGGTDMVVWLRDHNARG